MNRVKEFENDGYQVVQYSEKSKIHSGIIPLAFSTSIAFNITDSGFKERYCFPTPLDAIRELKNWHERDFNDQRPIGWIACRNVVPEELKSSIEKYYGKDYAINVLNAQKSIQDKTKQYVTEEQIAEYLNMELTDIKHEVAYLRATKQIE